MLAVDLVVVGFVVVSSFFRGTTWIEVLDPVFGTIILLDLVARLWIARRPLRELLHPITIADVIVIVSLLAPPAGENFAFLRVLRVLRVLRSYRTLARLRRDVPFFRRNQDVIFSVAEPRGVPAGDDRPGLRDPDRPQRGDHGTTPMPSISR